ncbi:hypothetical protein Pint_25212 [Pistacia integerrima]|uniref:Uncharacterized protein n=1 Tax=Pistacia integerrima TaxID=434235 RepID=A0ACC0YAR8_9ROSI|nr:hypothetical protein Pint_25212 [Pistacia integerrima]
MASFPENLREQMRALMDCDTLAEWEVNKLLSKANFLKKVATNLALVRLAELKRSANIAHVVHEEEVALYCRLIMDKDRVVAKFRFVQGFVWLGFIGFVLFALFLGWVDKVGQHFMSRNFQALALRASASALAQAEHVPPLATMRSRGNPPMAFPIDELGQIHWEYGFACTMCTTSTLHPKSPPKGYVTISEKLLSLQKIREGWSYYLCKTKCTSVGLIGIPNKILEWDPDYFLCPIDGDMSLEDGEEIVDRVANTSCAL